MNISKLHLRIDDLGTILNDYEYLMNINYDSRGWDYPRENEDQCCVWTAGWNFPWNVEQILKGFRMKSNVDWVHSPCLICSSFDLKLN